MQVGTIILLCIMVLDACTHNSKEAAIPSVSFSKQITPVFKASCAINSECHSGISNSGNNINLDSNAAYSSIITKKLVKTNAPSSSLLYVEISSGIMPKAPFPALSAADQELILNWITQGAKDN